MTYSEAIKKLRNKLILTQTEFGEVFGVSFASLCLFSSQSTGKGFINASDSFSNMSQAEKDTEKDRRILIPIWTPSFPIGR